MPTTIDIGRRRYLSAFCCLALGLFFLTNPITRFCVGGATSTGQIAAIGFIAPLHVVLMVGALLGITQLLRHRADRAGLIGATLVLAGWTISTRIMVIGQLDALLTNRVPGVPSDALQKIFHHAPWSSSASSPSASSSPSACSSSASPWPSPAPPPAPSAS